MLVPGACSALVGHADTHAPAPTAPAVEVNPFWHAVQGLEPSTPQDPARHAVSRYISLTVVALNKAFDS